MAATGSLGIVTPGTHGRAMADKRRLVVRRCAASGRLFLRQ
jgi:hypothetical protein